MYEEIIAALEEAAEDESAITVFTGKILKQALKQAKVWHVRGGGFYPSLSAGHVAPSWEAPPGCFRMKT